MAQFDVETQSVIDNIPNITNGNGKKLLYVGARERAHMLDLLLSYGYEIDIIEIWPHNINYIKSHYRYSNLIQGDITKAESLLPYVYDVIFWWHGPEHIEKNLLTSTLASLEKKAKLVVLGFPLEEIQFQDGSHFDNPYETHRWRIIPEDITNLGYNLIRVNRNPYPFDNGTAWKLVSGT